MNAKLTDAELIGRVAVDVMGWEMVGMTAALWWKKADGDYLSINLFDPINDMNDCFVVIDKLSSMGIAISLRHSDKHILDMKWECRLHDCNKLSFYDTTEVYEKPGRAVCETAYMAVKNEMP